MRGSQTDRPARPIAGRPMFAALLLGALLALALPGVLGAENDPALNAEKEFWQKRYSELLDDQKRLRETIERERELYADANRRNYRRGKKRHVHRDAMLEAQAKLEVVEEELAALPDEARRAGALPGWLYEVEMARE